MHSFLAADTSAWAIDFILSRASKVDISIDAKDKVCTHMVFGGVGQAYYS